MVSRQIGGSRPDNLITLCSVCHDKVTRGEIILRVKPSKGFKAETFISTVRWKLVDKLRDMGNGVSYTYGYITKSKRIELGLSKSHANDAYVIAGGTSQEISAIEYLIRQVRKCNRKLFKGDRSHIRNTAKRGNNVMQVIKPKEIIEEISNLKTGEKYKNDEEWKAKGIPPEDIRRDVRVIMPSLDLFGETK